MIRIFDASLMQTKKTVWHILPSDKEAQEDKTEKIEENSLQKV